MEGSHLVSQKRPRAFNVPLTKLMRGGEKKDRFSLCFRLNLILNAFVFVSRFILSVYILVTFVFFFIVVYMKISFGHKKAIFLVGASCRKIKNLRLLLITICNKW